jgi:hypothetical protein
MKYRAEQSSTRPSVGNIRNQYLDIINDDNGDEIVSIPLTKNGNIYQESFILNIMDIINDAYSFIGKISPFAKLQQADDDQRMMAIADIQRLLSIFDKAFSKGCVINDDANDLLEIAKRWNSKNGSMIFTTKKPEPLFI